MSYFVNNKKVLQKYYPGFFEEISAKDDDDLSPGDIKIETNPRGELTLCIKGLYAHSQRDPLREADRLVKSVCGSSPASDSPAVILGFGLGYAAQAAAASGKPVIVIEKHKILFLKAMELRDLSAFFSLSGLIFIVGGSGEGITEALSIASSLVSGGANTGRKTPPSVIRNKALVDLDGQWYGQAEERIRAWSMRDDVNTATHKRFGRRWVRNLSRNMKAVRDLPGVSRLVGLAQEKEPLPVFLAAAGPSLDRIKPLLGEIHERCIVVAVDTSLRFFVKNGLSPDFVVVVDPQFWNSRHLDRCVNGQVSERTALIAESAVYPPVLSLPFKNKFLCGSLFPLGTFIENQADPKGRLAAGGSVATTAWDFARMLQGNDIWIAGLDLAFPGLKTHFRGARFEETAASQSNRFNPCEKWVVRALRDGRPRMALSANGGQVLTDQRLSLYKAWFESQFRKNDKIQNRGFFSDGIAIAGLGIADVDEFKSLPERRGEIDKRLRNAFIKIDAEFNDPEEKKHRHERYEKAVSSLESGLKNIKAAAEKGAEIARRALKYPPDEKKRGHILYELDKITRHFEESEVKEVAGFLFPEVDEENGGKDTFRAYLKSTLKLFSGVAEAADFYITRR